MAGRHLPTKGVIISAMNRKHEMNYLFTCKYNTKLITSYCESLCLLVLTKQYFFNDGIKE